ncbi:MAG: twin-arginine translocation pathway signal protein [Elusimicrobia bacterium]|nr:MAG: twin-arginine translocation pathway signal protein [Elusimicrobiota bacterium]
MRNRIIIAAFLLFSGSTVYRILTGDASWAVTTRGGDPSQVTLKIWAGNAAPIDHWRTDSAVDAARTLNRQLEEEGSGVRVTIDAINDPASWGNYKKKFLMAADSHLAPDIICTGHEDIASWASAGLIVPLADTVAEMRAKDPAFADVREDLWESTMFRGKIWGVPQDSEARVLFYSKPLLAKMGWTPARMKTLERGIQDGSFTTDDMIALAEKAVASGVVPRGRGYWHRPTRGSDHIQKYYAFGGRIDDPETGRLVADQQSLTRWFTFQRRIVDAGITPENYLGTEWGIWHNTVSHGKALFWEGGIWNWSSWGSKYAADLGGEAYLHKSVGYAMPPAGSKGGTPATLVHPLVYLVPKAKASGQMQQKLALRLLALMTTPEINTRHALDSSHLAILKSQLDYAPYKENTFLYGISKLGGKSFFQPNHVRFSQWFDIVMGAMEEAQSGRRSPSQAAADAIALMRIDVGEDNLVFR